MNIGIVFGGPSVEHDISIITATQIYAAIDKKKYNVMPIYYSKDKKFYEVKNFGCAENFVKDIKILEEITINRLGAKKTGKFAKIKKIDCVISAFHGKNTESGELAGFFDVLGIPYTSNGVLGASIGQDKNIMKKILKYDGISVLDFVCVNIELFNKNNDFYIKKIEEMGYPVIIKPSMLGSSIGIKVANDQETLKKALNFGFKYDKNVVVEKKLNNFREFNCAIIENDVSKIEEVVVKNNIFTFEDKYQTKESAHILPAIIEKELEDEICDLTKRVSVSLCNESVARVDFLYDNDAKKLYVNEINTIPGALAYYLFEEKGIYFDELIDKIINLAMKKDYKNKLLINSFSSTVLDNTKKGLKMKK